MLNYKKILYATDLHASCKETLERLLVFANKFDAEVTVLHVIKPISGMYGYTAGIASDVDLEIEKKAIGQLQELMNTVGLDKAQAIIRKGQYSNAIIEHADDENIDAIVLNGHTHNIFARMGSTEDCVINNAHCDVIVSR